MTETFLHYIWQYRLFDSNNLRTVDGLSIEVVKPGHYNSDAGPDFFNAKLRIDGTLWAGNVEIHIRSSEWKRHQHQMDPVYDSCILHVVYEYDASVKRMNGTIIPAIELKNKFPVYLWENYLKLIGTRGWISCQPRIKETDENTWRITIDRMIHERLENRAKQIFISLNGNREDWEECFYQHLSRNFGFQLNAIPFEMLARSLPIKIIRKENNNFVNIEALLFGQAGMLMEKYNEDYPKHLQEIYRHLSKKYSLTNIPFFSWKFLRLRPVNFPAIRLAQFSKLLSQNFSLFNSIIETKSLKNIYSIFEVKASEYWNTHYCFTNSSSYKVKKIGTSSINNILINTCIPFLYAWGKYVGANELSERALEFLKKIPAEDNRLIKHWNDIGVKASSAVDSQSLMQLKIMHCSEKKCLECAIGKNLIQNLPLA